MIVAPGCTLAGGMLIFSDSDSAVFVPAVLAFFLYQTWHFGAQNIGVAAFISLADRGKPLTRMEKVTIKMGIVVGMFGVLRVMAPTYMIGEQYMPIGSTAVRLMEFSYDVGALAAIPLTAGAFWLAVRAWCRKQYLFGIAIFLSVTYLFTMYLTRDYLLGFISFTTAHGLQYLIFLFTHSVNRRKQDLVASYSPIAIIAAPAALLVAMVIGSLIFNNAPAIATTKLPSIGVAIVLSITLVHFWLDLFLWRMRNKERANWIRARFGFVLGAPSAQRDGKLPR